MRKIKIIIFTIFAISFLSPVFVFAQNQEVPTNAAENINVDLKIPLPFVDTNCSTKDSFGNTVEAVCNLSDYLEGVYKFLVGVGVLFAIVMMVIAGYQWMFAGGGERQTGAKKRLFGAAIGLLLALLSFVFLNAVSSRLVELNLPEVKVAQPFFTELGGQRCDEIVDGDGNTIVAQRFSEVNSRGYNILYSDAASTVCGKEYDAYDIANIQNAKPISKCGGINCAQDGYNCIQNTCRPIMMYGNIRWGVAAGDLDNIFSNAYVDFMKIYSVCNSQLDNLIIGKDIAEKATVYIIENNFSKFVDTGNTARTTNIDYIAKMQEAIKDCTDDGKSFNGFVSEIEINDDKNSWGVIFPTLDDDFLVGKDCARPFSGETLVGVSDLNNKLFQLSDFQKGVKCDFNIRRSFFPAQSL